MLSLTQVVHLTNQMLPSELPYKPEAFSHISMLCDSVSASRVYKAPLGTPELVKSRRVSIIHSPEEVIRPYSSDITSISLVPIFIRTTIWGMVGHGEWIFAFMSRDRLEETVR